MAKTNRTFLKCLKSPSAIVIVALPLNCFAFSPQHALSSTRTGTITPRRGPSNKVKFESNRLETTCTLKTRNGRLAYYVDTTNGNQYISSAKKSQVLSGSIQEISTNAAKSGQVRAKANLPKGRWKLVFDQATLNGKSTANQKQIRVSNLNGGNASGWSNRIGNYRPQVNPNNFKDLAVDVRFRNNYFEPGVYRASVVVTCMAT